MEIQIVFFEIYIYIYMFRFFKPSNRYGDIFIKIVWYKRETMMIGDMLWLILAHLLGMMKAYTLALVESAVKGWLLLMHDWYPLVNIAMV